MKALLRHSFQYMKFHNPIFVHPRESNRTKKNDTSKLSYEILVPRWYDDPTHCHNIVVYNMCELSGQVKKKSSITMCY